MRRSDIISPFPRIARGHSSKHSKDSFIGGKCHVAGCINGEAHYSRDRKDPKTGQIIPGGYVDGHFQNYATALRAHEEGIR